MKKSDFLFSRSKYGMQAIFPLSRARVGGAQYIIPVSFCLLRKIKFHTELEKK